MVRNNYVETIIYHDPKLKLYIFISSNVLKQKHKLFCIQ